MPETLATSAPREGYSSVVPARDGRLPIMLGVTGHRAIRGGDEDGIAGQIRALLARLQHDCPHSPMVLLTSLAEGADRLAARVALGAGARLIAVLPLAETSYASDFASDASRADFRLLLAKADRCITMPILDPGADVPGDARNVQYLLSGLFIARHSDVLIALWDGNAARGTGGTAQVVAFRQTGRLEAEPRVRAALAASPDPFGVIDAPLDAPQTGLVYHVPAARPDAVAPSSASSWLVPPLHDATARSRDRFVDRSLTTLRHRDSFNGEGMRSRARHAARIDAARSLLTRGELSAPRALDDLRETYALADAMAVRHQRSMYRLLIALFVLVAVATISLLLRNLATTDAARRAYLAGYLLLLAVADLAYLRTRTRKSQDRFQDYRALAEGLRVQFFWRLAGSTRAAADYYLRKQRTELRWIRDALRVCALGSTSSRDGDIEAVQRLWVEEQRDYYHRASHRDGRRRRRYRAIGSALVLLSLVATVAWLWSISRSASVYLAIAAGAALVLVAHCVYEVIAALRESNSTDRGTLRDMARAGVLSVVVAIALYAALAYGGPLLAGRAPGFAIGNSPLEWMLGAIGLTALLGTFAHAYANIRAFGEHQKQYERMEELFRTADDALTRASPGSDDARRTIDRVLFDLGREALAEHADWLLLHRARPIELPTAEI